MDKNRITGAAKRAKGALKERLGRLTQLWAVPAYRLMYDPDGRSWEERLRNRW